jgi:hypothetical protein
MSTLVLRLRAVTLGLVALVVAACALALTPAPVAVRALVTVPVLVGVAGSAAARAVLGPRSDADAVLRATLPVALGMVALLGSVLLAAGLGWRIDTPGITAAAGLVTLALIVGARRRTLLPSGAGGSPEATAAVALPARRTLRATAGVVGAVLVLAAAVAGAIALRPAPVERYAQIALDSAVAVTGEPVAARPDQPVTLDWTLSGYGGPLTASDPAVDVTVGGAPARGLAVLSRPPSPADPATGAVDVQPGSVTFRAPETEGLYPVRITVARSVLVATLKVTR